MLFELFVCNVYFESNGLAMFYLKLQKLHMHLLICDILVYIFFAIQLITYCNLEVLNMYN